MCLNKQAVRCCGTKRPWQVNQQPRDRRGVFGATRTTSNDGTPARPLGHSWQADPVPRPRPMSQYYVARVGPAS